MGLFFFYRLLVIIEAMAALRKELDGLPAAAPASAEAAGEPLLAQLQALLLELEVTEGELHSPCGRHRYAIHDGIANMVVDLAARAGSAATRKHGGAVGVGTAVAAAEAAASAPVQLAADGVPVHRLYRRREKVEVCVMQGDAEPGGEKLQAEAVKLAPAVAQLAQARKAGRISDAECVGGFLLVYLQERHSKSWLCGPRNGANAHRMAFAAAEEAGDGERPAKRHATAADGPESGLAIEQVPGLTLSEYHRNKLLSGGRRQQPSKKQRADTPAEDGAADADAAAAAQQAPAVVPMSLLDLFAGWQLASVPNYASRALISWAGQPDGGRTPTTALSFLRPSPASHLSLHATGGRYVTLRLAESAVPTVSTRNLPVAGALYIFSESLLVGTGPRHAERRHERGCGAGSRNGAGLGGVRARPVRVDPARAEAAGRGDGQREEAEGVGGVLLGAARRRWVRDRVERCMGCDVVLGLGPDRRRDGGEPAARAHAGIHEGAPHGGLLPRA
jgi:hypothetical protein